VTRRFHTLDGMRGVAALTVAFGHYNNWLLPLKAPHIWLAVDLFFIISGVVISQVYDGRLRAGMTTMTFMTQRYLRLYPLYFLGTLIGAASGFATWATGHGSMTLVGLGTAGLTATAMLPSPTWQTNPSIMPFNDPGWSLFFELVANLVFVALWRFWNTRTLSLIVALSGTAVLYQFESSGNGFGGAKWITFFWGFPRVGFSFFLGVIISRQCVGRAAISNWAWMFVPVLTLILVADQSRPPYVDVMIQFLVLPLIVLVAVRVEPRSVSIMPSLGRISYPLYAIHMPIAFLLWRSLLVVHRSPQSIAPFGGLVLLIVVVVLSAWLDQHYDHPVRSWLTKLMPFAKPRSALEEAEAI